MNDIIKELIWAKNKTKLRFPFTEYDYQPYFGEGMLCDALSFGFSYIEHEDHFVQYILAHPLTVKDIIRSASEIVLTVDTDYIGKLWTAHLYVSDKLNSDKIIFSNTDKNTVLELQIIY